MKVEHFALNVADPVAMADWYAKHLGMTIARQFDNAARTTFLADSQGAVMLEIYNNPPEAVPNYREMDPLLIHLAFVSEDPETDKARLLEAGATLVEEFTMADGSRLMMMRDPWGLAIQFCKRAVPFGLVTR
jgi:catechol 2,3-dioxygenase-like lactoylglutathione lyase family enzyme